MPWWNMKISRRAWKKMYVDQKGALIVWDWRVTQVENRREHIQLVLVTGVGREGVQLLTCSRPPVSPVLFRWFVNSLRGDSDESRANNNIANIGTSSPRVIRLCSWTATSNIKSFVASRILNSSVSLLSKDRVESIRSGWLGLSHISRICKTTHIINKGLYSVSRLHWILTDIQ